MVTRNYKNSRNNSRSSPRRLVVSTRSVLPPTRDTLHPEPLKNRGMTLVELIFGLIIISVMIAVAAPALQVAMGRNSVEAEAQRLVTDLHFARSEAVKRGLDVHLCQSDAASCDIEDLRTCRCRSGVAAKRYDFGWLIHTARDGKKDFDEKKGDILLRVGEPAHSGILMQTNVAIELRVSFDRRGGLDAAAGGLVAVCQDGLSTEEVPGRLISLAATGRARIDRMAPGQDCLSNQGQGQNQGQGPGVQAQSQGPGVQAQGQGQGVQGQGPGQGQGSGGDDGDDDDDDDDDY